MQLQLDDRLREGFRRVRETQLTEWRAARPQAADEVFVSEEVVRLMSGCGHSCYLTLDGRVIAINYGEGLPPEVLDDPREVAACIVRWAGEAGLPELVNLLPPIPDGGEVCFVCRGTRYMAAELVGGQPGERLFCRRCGGLGWTHQDIFRHHDLIRMGIRMNQPTPESSAPVDTAKVAGRRMLRFESIDQMLADVNRLVEAERAGRLRRLGNWTPGQTLGHLAAWMEFGYTGVPLKVPFFIRWILRLRKRKFLYQPMRAGVRIPGVKGGTLATDLLPLDEALTRFRGVTERFKTEAPTAPSPVFGQLTHEESIALNLRHAELHLGFLIPE